MPRNGPDKSAKRRRRGYLALSLALLLALAACGGEQAGTAPTEGGSPADDGGGDSADPGGGDEQSVTVAWTAAPTTLDPARATGGHDTLALDNVYDGLVRRARDGGAEPALATDWEYSEDGLSVTVNLREGVRFHNGDEMTAEDVAYSLNRWLDPDFGVEQGSVNYEHVEGTEVVDDYTVVVNFTSPQPTWIHTSPEYTQVIPAGFAEEAGDDFASSPETAIGTGPYRVVGWTRDTDLTLEAFDDHWRGAPAIKDVVIRGIPDESARTAALLSGDVDIVHSFSLDQLDVLERTEGVEARPVSSPLRQMIQLNAHAKPDTPLAQLEVRQAVALALDLQSIIDNVLYGLGELAPIITLPIEPGFNDELEPYGYDPDRARELLADAGYPDGIQGLDFYTRTREPKAQEVAEAMQAMWADVGIEVNLTVLEDDDFANQIESDDFDINVWGFRGGGTFHPAHHMATVFACDAGSATWSRKYCNEEVAEILTERAPAAAVESEEASFELYREAQAILHEEYAMAGVWSQPFVFATKSALNWEPHPEGNMWMYDASW